MACPQSIIIVGSGVFGLSTAYAMAKDAMYLQTSITLVDSWDFEPEADEKHASVANPRAANHDTTRIIRSEYPHGPYATLAREAHVHWRGEWGECGRYVERRLLLCAEGSSLLQVKKKAGETVNYVKDALALSRKSSRAGGDSLRILDSLSEIQAEFGVESPVAAANCKEKTWLDEKDVRGYISPDAGWADSGATMAWLRQQVIRSRRVQTWVGQAENLLYRDRKSGASAAGPEFEVCGVELACGQRLFADVTIVAAGSHTPRLIGMEGLCDVYSEVVAYIRLSAGERRHLEQIHAPIIVNATRCVFAVGPDGQGHLKLGKFSHSGRMDVRHCAGMTATPRQHMAASGTQHGGVEFGWGSEVEASENLDESARGTLAEYRNFLVELFDRGDAGVNPLRHLAQRPFAQIRRCWYTDTQSTDFIVDYHPASSGTLFVATGGSDHAFKFVPIIGTKIAALLLKGRGVSSSVDKDVGLTELREAWRFPCMPLK